MLGETAWGVGCWMSTKTYFLKRGTKIIIVFGRYAGWTGTVDANVLQKSIDFPAEYTAGFRVQLDDGNWVTVRADQVAKH